MFKMLYDLNFTYDSSMPVYENKPPSWPYTLDYKIFHDCMIPPCPTKSYPGVWEVPMVMWQDLNGGRCSMGDGCSNPPDAEGIYKMLIKNFERHYTSNRFAFIYLVSFKYIFTTRMFSYSGHHSPCTTTRPGLRHLITRRVSRPSLIQSFLWTTFGW